MKPMITISRVRRVENIRTVISQRAFPRLRFRSPGRRQEQASSKVKETFQRAHNTASGPLSGESVA